MLINRPQGVTILSVETIDMQNTSKNLVVKTI